LTIVFGAYFGCGGRHIENRDAPRAYAIGDGLRV
jgi:hypothetical protein